MRTSYNEEEMQRGPAPILLTNPTPRNALTGCQHLSKQLFVRELRRGTGFVRADEVNLRFRD